MCYPQYLIKTFDLSILCNPGVCSLSNIPAISDTFSFMYSDNSSIVICLSSLLSASPLAISGVEYINPLGPSIDVEMGVESRYEIVSTLPAAVAQIKITF